MPSVEDLVSSPETELATVICNPPRITAPPRPQTIRVWNGDQLSRSRRAGIRLRIGRAPASVVVMDTPSGSSGRHGASVRSDEARDIIPWGRIRSADHRNPMPTGETDLAWRH